MSQELARTAGGALGAPIFGAEDPFEVIFRPAQPTLDAVVEIWNALAWFDRKRHSRFDLTDDAQAERILAIIPDDARLIEAQARFREAEFEPAPEPWLHLAVGVMLASLPDAANVHDAYRCSIADSAYRDPEVWGRYTAGFSCAVIARTIRWARLQSSLPSSGAFITACVRHRSQFGRWRKDLGVMINLSSRAKTWLGQIGPDHPDFIPF
jgi:hypothetical protein